MSRALDATPVQFTFGPWKSRRLPVSVGELHVLEAAGRGPLPPAVVLHGFGASSLQLFPLTRRLRGRVRRISSPDLPGHGLSDTPRGGMRADAMKVGITELLDGIIDEPVILFGSSMGGFASIRYAAQNPHKIHALVLSSPGGAPMEAEALDRFLDTFRVGSHDQALDFVDRLLVKKSRLRHLLAAGVKRKFERPAMRSLIGSVTVEDLLTPQELAALTMPILLMWGTDERILPPEHLRFFRDHLPPHARIEHPVGFGHSPYLEEPEALVAQIDRFLGGLEAPRAAS